MFHRLLPPATEEEPADTATRPGLPAVNDGDAAVAHGADILLSRVARAAAGVRYARMCGRGEKRAQRRLDRAVDRAAAAGLPLGDPPVRDRLAQHLEGIFAAFTVPDFTPRTDWATAAQTTVARTAEQKGDR
ncbi:hypothetical protein [Nocardia sp. alder85J]|uniref:hypothetical protein n=1 Tax=Nocardia sp. alder85J TaxID=2862949 RepID=UPI001CD63E3E|nr:hypothetical protein [Nocardia sp. alder85J]MCX4099266.1 hypothetical protein [Nocardia sp. alder85J]